MPRGLRRHFESLDPCQRGGLSRLGAKLNELYLSLNGVLVTTITSSVTFTWPEQASWYARMCLVVRCGGGGSLFGLMVGESGDHILTNVQADRRGWLATNGYRRVKFYSFA